MFRPCNILWLAFFIASCTIHELLSMESISCKNEVLERDFDREQSLMLEELSKADISSDEMFVLTWDSPDEDCVIDRTEFPPLPVVHIRTPLAPLTDYSLLLQRALVLHGIDGPLTHYADSLHLLNAERLVIHAYACGHRIAPDPSSYRQAWEILLTPSGVSHVRLSLIPLPPEPPPATESAAVSIAFSAAELPSDGLLISVHVDGADGARIRVRTPTPAPLGADDAPEPGQQPSGRAAAARCLRYVAERLPGGEPIALSARSGDGRNNSAAPAAAAASVDAPASPPPPAAAALWCGWEERLRLPAADGQYAVRLHSSGGATAQAVAWPEAVVTAGCRPDGEGLVPWACFRLDAFAPPPAALLARRAAVLAGCGALCDTTPASLARPCPADPAAPELPGGGQFALACRHKPAPCAALWANAALDAPIPQWPPPAALPAALRPDYTYGGRVAEVPSPGLGLARELGAPDPAAAAAAAAAAGWTEAGVDSLVARLRGGDLGVGYGPAATAAVRDGAARMGLRGAAVLVLGSRTPWSVGPRPVP
jgi:hypothetical protein